MIITKTVYTERDPSIHTKQPEAYLLYWKIGCGWIAMKWAATRFTTDEQVTRWLDRAAATIQNSDREILDVLEET